MDRIKLYVDEDAQRTDLIRALRARHVDVLTVAEAALLGQPDDTYPVWTPYGIPGETVEKLAAMLAEEQASYDS